MTVSETDDVSGTNRDSECIANRNKDKLSARRKGTSGESPMKVNTDNLPPASVACGLEHSNWVESWLDEHPDFFQAYLIRKGTRSMIDSWLVTHALPPGITATTLNNVDEEELEVDTTDVLEIHDGGSLGQMDISVGSSNPNITVQDENSAGAVGNTAGTNNVQAPSGAVNKVIHKCNKLYATVSSLNYTYLCNHFTALQ